MTEKEIANRIINELNNDNECIEEYLLDEIDNIIDDEELDMERRDVLELLDFKIIVKLKETK